MSKATFEQKIRGFLSLIGKNAPVAVYEDDGKLFCKADGFTFQCNRNSTTIWFLRHGHDALPIRG